MQAYSMNDCREQARTLSGLVLWVTQTALVGHHLLPAQMQEQGAGLERSIWDRKLCSDMLGGSVEAATWLVVPQPRAPTQTWHLTWQYRITFRRLIRV